MRQKMNAIIVRLNPVFTHRTDRIGFLAQASACSVWADRAIGALCEDWL